jgi:hypothetical protein
MTKKTLGIIVFIVASLLMCLAFFKQDKDQQTLEIFLTWLGSLTALYGIWLTYVQIMSVKQTAETTKKAVESSSQLINKILSVSEITKGTKVIQEVQTYFLHQKNELALLRMKDLKAILIQIKYNQELARFTKIDTYTSLITDLSIDINNLNDSILGTKKGFNVVKANQNLSNIETVLTDFESKLKFSNNDTG